MKIKEVEKPFNSLKIDSIPPLSLFEMKTKCCVNYHDKWIPVMRIKNELLFLDTRTYGPVVNYQAEECRQMTPGRQFVLESQ